MMQLTVVEEDDTLQCTYKYKPLRKLKDWRFYCDVFSYTDNAAALFNIELTRGHFFNQLRLHSLFLYYRMYCSSMKIKYKDFFIKLALTCLILHALTCTYMVRMCRNYSGENFPVNVQNLTDYSILTIDTTSFKLPNLTKDYYCHIDSDTIWKYSPHFEEKIAYTTFVFVNKYINEYKLSLLMIMTFLTNTNIYPVSPVSVSEILWQVFLRILATALSILVAGYIISTVYTSYIEMYNFDFEVKTLLLFLKQNGLSSLLRDSVRTYTRLLWLRTKGTWLPKITYRAPLCLQEDILGALYMHHLLVPAAFQQLPEYFLRQVVARFSRTVIFPGKTITQEGDINPILYFIHEGEVEKWYIDKKGDSCLASVLTTNGYFGLIPGLFPDTPYAFSYCTRTVVDLVYLTYESWKDLLHGYPDIKKEIYSLAKKNTRDVGVRSRPSSRTSLRSRSAQILSDESVEVTDNRK